MNEKTFAPQLYNALKDIAFVQRIETGLITLGVPDMLLCQHLNDIWMEIKAVEKNFLTNKRKTFSIPWEMSQLVWARNYQAATGRCVYTVCRTNDGILVIPMIRFFTDYKIIQNGDAIEKDLYYFYKNPDCIQRFIRDFLAIKI